MNLYIEYTEIQIVRGIQTQSFRKKMKMDVEQNKYTNHHTYTYKHTVTELHIHIHVCTIVHEKVSLISLYM